MLTTQALNEMNPERLRMEIKQALCAAIDDLLAKDLDLLISGAHEQAICHRLAVHLEKWTTLNVDCEYNRDMMRAKMLKGKRRFRPDIIIHRRLRNDENVLVVETKSQAHNSVSDVQRLSELTAESSDYRYSAGAFVTFHNRSSTMLKRGVLRVTGDWYFGSEREGPIARERSIPNDLMHQIRSVVSTVQR
jgi:hypothetical protein